MADLFFAHFRPLLSANDASFDWEKFVLACSLPLPLSFRIQLNSPFGQATLTQFLEHWQPTLTSRGVRSERIPFLGAAFKVETDKAALRSAHRDFQLWLTQRKADGSIWRQEAVSMVPVAVLGVARGMDVLDLCAAPGSKTSQALSMMATAEAGLESEGLLVANDADPKRACVLASGLKSLGGRGCVVVTSHKAELFPDLGVRFDRVICDVPCSGDGVMRKAMGATERWDEKAAWRLHPEQLSIALRGAQLLKVGGRMTYSTCSLNPIENEAVVAALLERYGPGLRVVDPGIAIDCASGFLDWPCAQGAPETARAPGVDKARDLNLQSCLRFYPHQSLDSGGFFVCLLEKTQEQEEGAGLLPEKVSSRRPLHTVGSDSLVFLSEGGPLREVMDNFFPGSPGPSLPGHAFSRDPALRKLYLMNDRARALISLDASLGCPLNITDIGLRLATATSGAHGPGEAPCPHLSFECLSVLGPRMTGRRAQVSLDEARALVTTTVLGDESMAAPTRAWAASLGPGPAAVHVTIPAHGIGRVFLPVWITASHRVRLYLQKEDLDAVRSITGWA
jgi:16S rRNA C967 or C1407 C5-methylase (RsmB/RsmF family)